MELTLKRLLEQADFAQAKRGYDRDEVDDFLDRAVAMATKVEAKLTQTMEQAKLAAEAPAGAPQPSPAEIDAEVERRVAARLAEERAEAPAEPSAPAGPSEEERAEEMRRTLVLAQRTADAAIAEAREEAAKLRAEADREVADRRAQLDRELSTERDAANERIRGEIAELEGVREALRSDVGVLERHVEEQRNQLRSTVGELQRLLEDPAGFRLAPTPALLDPVVPLGVPGSVLDDAEPEAGSDAAPVAETPGSDPEPSTEAAGSDAAGTAPTPTDAVTDAAATDAVAAGAGPETAGSDVSQPPSPDPEEPINLFGRPAEPAPPADQGGLSFGDVEHEPPTAPASPSGPPTEALPATGDPFMDELRKAMSDDEPLGPRDDDAGVVRDLSGDFDDDDRRGWRFGKRR